MIVASIDLMGGEAVQLKQGKEKILSRNNPLELAKEFDRFGEVAIIDLDAALGNGDHKALIKKLLKVAECRVGGGIKTVEAAREWVSLGARKIIVGSMAFQHDQLNRAFLNELCAAIGKERVIIAVDSRNREIVTRGWRHQTGLPLLETVTLLQEYCGELLFTCVEREGTMTGIDLQQVKDLQEATALPITVAGGVNTLEQVEILSQLGVDIQLGMALYTGEIDLAEAFVRSLNWKETLLPTIVQDQAGQVLMLGYSNRDSLKEAYSGGLMCFYSRSRKELWRKGDTSGNVQKLIRMRADCDRDAILVTVDQKNAACHTNWYSCFGEEKFGLQSLQRTIASRFENSPPGSYTAKLASGDLLYQKIMEEAQEVIEAREREHIIWEAADLMFFLSALLTRNDIAVEEVLSELRRRRLK